MQGKWVSESGFVTHAHLSLTQLSLEQSVSVAQWAPTGETQAGVSPDVDE